MSRLVVDTDVVSFLFKNHSIAKLYDSELLGHTLVLSFMTVAELDRWAIQSAQLGRSTAHLAESLPGAFRNSSFQSGALYEMGGSYGGCSSKRISNRVCGCLDRHHRAALRSCARDS
jgi:predicted nucleic acid-binding protein